jgi:hypothetical protein
MMSTALQEKGKRENMASVKETMKATGEYIPTVEGKEGMEKMPIDGALAAPKEGPKVPEAAAETNDKKVKEDLLFSTSSNETYHDKILQMLKITNNRPLNTLYYNVVPTLNKGALLKLDLSSGPHVLLTIID